MSWCRVRYLSVKSKWLKAARGQFLCSVYTAVFVRKILVRVHPQSEIESVILSINKTSVMVLFDVKNYSLVNKSGLNGVWSASIHRRPKGEAVTHSIETMGYFILSNWIHRLIGDSISLLACPSVYSIELSDWSLQSWWFQTVCRQFCCSNKVYIRLDDKYSLSKKILDIRRVEWTQKVCND